MSRLGRNRAWFSVLAAGGLSVLAVLAASLSGTNDDPGNDPSSARTRLPESKEVPPLEAPGVAPAEGRESEPETDVASVDSSVERVDAASDFGEIREVRVVETLEAGPFANARIWDADGTTTEMQPRIETDAAGGCRMSDRDLARLGERRYRPMQARRTWEGRPRVVALAVSSIGRPDREGVVEIQVATLSRLVVTIQSDGFALEGLRLRLTSLPPIPQSNDLDARARTILETLRRSDPVGYLRDLQRRVGEVESTTVELLDDAIEASGTTFTLPWRGDAAIELEDAVGRRSKRIVGLELGQVTTVECELHDYVFVSGTVRYRDGTPAAGVEVKVGTFARIEAGQRMPDYPSGSKLEESSLKAYAATVIDDPRPGEFSTVHHLGSTISGPDGTYRASMVFSDEVTAWVIEPEHGAGFVSRDVATPTESVTGLDLVLDTPPAQPRGPRLIDSTGGVLANCTVRISLMESSPFMVAYPNIRTDSEGVLDLWFVADGVLLRVDPQDAGVYAASFCVGSNDTLRFNRRLPAK